MTDERALSDELERARDEETARVTEALVPGQSRAIHTAENDAPMRVEVDPDAGTMYVHLRIGRVARTASLSDVVNVDISADGNALGVEVLGIPTRVIPPGGSVD